MRTAFYEAIYEWKQLSRMRTVLLVLLGLPLLLIFLLGYGLDDQPDPIRTAVWTEGGEAGQAFDHYLQDEADSQLITVLRMASEREVEEAVRNGAADYGYVLYAPASLSTQGETGIRAAVYPGRFVERNMPAGAVFARFLADAELTAAAAVFGADGGKASSGEGAAIPYSEAGVIVNDGTPQSGGGAFGGVSSLQYYAAAYIIMFLLFAGMAAAISLMDEREKGTLLRLHAMPIRMSSILAGKFTAYMLFGLLQAAVIMLFSHYVYGTEWGSEYGLLLLICLLTSIIGICWAIVLASFLHSSKATESTFVLLVTVMTFISGGMIPTLGPVIHGAGKLTPNYYASDAVRTLMNGGGWPDIASEVGVLAAAAAVSAALLLIRIRKAASLA